MKKQFMLAALTGLLAACGGDGSDSSANSSELKTKAALGEALFSDTNLSANRTQSCATCHNLDHGFIDERTLDQATDPNITFAASLGDDGQSLGDRNAPTAGYAFLSPNFHQGSRERVASQRTSGIASYEGFLGGQFWDGRETDLKGQAGGPPTNPVEMGMPNKASVVERLKENPDYIQAFEELFGSNIFNDVEQAYSAMAESIGEFEKTSTFAPFDSKYDRSLKIMDRYPFEAEYTYQLGSLADEGKTLFLSSDLSCAACHQLNELKNTTEPFTSFEYHNIGVPKNTELRTLNGVTDIDLGLFLNPVVEGDENQKGKFKVPTLRNIAVTEPYMHNGVFNTLEAVIQFYEHTKFRAIGGEELYPNNPETGLPWAAAEVNMNISHDLLGANDIELGERQVDALVCFMMSLTDARYEPLLDPQKIEECGL